MRSEFKSINPPPKMRHQVGFAAMAALCGFVQLAVGGSFLYTGSLNTGRWGHAAVSLQDGRVLVTGGSDSNSVRLSSGELYDPATGKWTGAGSMTTARWGHTLTLLPDGSVLAAGGYDSNSQALASAELYNSATGGWLPTPPMTTPRYEHTATLLNDGTVLVTGGYNTGYYSISSSELYDPAAGTWTTNAAMSVGRWMHTATLLPDGQVMVCGGYNAGASLSSAELYDPASRSWSLAGFMSIARYRQTATLLPAGQVLVAGGLDSSSILPLTSAELFDPTTETWTPTGTLNVARMWHQATSLTNGQVLVTGGHSAVSRAELYDPGSETWTPTNWMNIPRFEHTATLLTNGAVLIAGGRYLNGAPANAELFESWLPDHSPLRSLYSFTPLTGPNGTNADGFEPTCLILAGNTLYGVAHSGGSCNSGDGCGTVFTLNIDGTGFATLYSFSGDDGAGPAFLTLSSNRLFGITTSGGSGWSSGTGNYGTVFALNTDGTGFATLHSFSGGDGMRPTALAVSNSVLYGTTTGGSFNGTFFGNGTVFSINTDGTGFRTPYTFTPLPPYPGPYTNSDGADPVGLILSSNRLYGVAQFGGSSGNGTIFALNTDGTGFTALRSLSAGHLNSGNYGSDTNVDGSDPVSLILSGSTLYGTTATGGAAAGGTVFALNTDGSGFSVLRSFDPASDGVNPSALILARDTLYGATSGIFTLNTDGTGFTTLYRFNGGAAGTDGGAPDFLISSGDTLYGLTEYGGNSGTGTVFSLLVPPRLMIVTAGSNAILTWSTNATGFTLQSTTNLGASPVWTTNSVAAFVVNGQNTVTNPISGTQQFYRLAR